MPSARRLSADGSAHSAMSEGSGEAPASGSRRIERAAINAFADYRNTWMLPPDVTVVVDAQVARLRSAFVGSRAST